jgi:hypothetical protein
MRFIEETHKYTEDNLDYIPVTYFLKSFQPWVDWDKEAEKKAKKLGLTKEELLKQWDEKKNKAAERGTAFHKIMEDMYLNSKEIVVDNTACPVSAVATVDGVKEDTSMKLQDNTVYTEKMIWSPKYRICGTADLVEVINGKINVKDYKTNEKLDWEGWKHPILGTKRLKMPVSHLDDCNGSIYTLQINTYMYMLLQQNRHLKIGDMKILHVAFTEDGHNIVEHPVRNMQQEVKAMLEAFKLKRGL